MTKETVEQVVEMTSKIDKLKGVKDVIVKQWGLRKGGYPNPTWGELSSALEVLEKYADLTGVLDVLGKITYSALQQCEKELADL